MLISSASTKQKTQDGNYFDSFIGLDFLYDKEIKISNNKWF